MNRSSTRTVFAIQSTADNHRGAGWFYRKPTTAKTRLRQWVALEDATTWPSYADALRHQTTLDVSHGRKCTRLVELELALKVRGDA